MYKTYGAAEADIDQLKDELMAQWEHRLSDMGSSIPLTQAVANIQKVHQSASTAKNRDVVLTLGETGTGKSTLINYLDGVRYRHQEGANKRLTLGIKAISGQEVAEVGHSRVVSHTTLPKVYPIGELSLVDLAGLNGTREAAVELAGAMGAHLIAKHARSIKSIFFTVDYNTFLTQRGQPFRDAIETLCQVLGGGSKIAESGAMQSVCFALTKVPPSVTKEEIIARYIEPMANSYLEQDRRRTISKDGITVYLTLKKMLEKPEDIYIANVTDNGESANAILHAMQESTPVSADQVNLLTMEEHQDNFNTLVTLLAEEYLARHRALYEQAPREKSELEGVLAEHQHGIHLLELEIQHLIAKGMTQDSFEQLLSTKTQHQTQLLERIRSRSTELIYLNAKVNTSQSCLDNINTDEPVPFGLPIRHLHTAEFTILEGEVDNRSFLESLVDYLLGADPLEPPSIIAKEGSRSITLTNSQNPAPGNILCVSLKPDTDDQVNFSNLQITENHFTVDLSYPLGSNSLSEAIPMIASRDLPVNRSRIHALEAEIDSAKRSIQALEPLLNADKSLFDQLTSEIFELQSARIDAAMRDEKLRIAIDNNRTKKEATQQLLEPIETQIYELNERLRQLDLELKVYYSLFNTLADVAQILDMDRINVVIADFITAFNNSKSEADKEHQQPASAHAFAGAGDVDTQSAHFDQQP